VRVKHHINLSEFHAFPAEPIVMPEQSHSIAWSTRSLHFRLCFSISSTRRYRCTRADAS